MIRLDLDMENRSGRIVCPLLVSDEIEEKPFNTLVENLRWKVENNLWNWNWSGSKFR